MTAHLIISPLQVPISAKKKFTLSLTTYRNTHYLVLNKAKLVYKAAMAPQIKRLPVFETITTVFVLYPKTKRLTDLDNILPIHSKFFMDALVELGRLPDDNYLHHPRTTYRFGGVDKRQPRVEIWIGWVAQ